MRIKAFLSGWLQRWYRWTMPPMPPQDAPLARRILAHRQCLISITILVSLFFVVLAFPLVILTPSPLAPFQSVLEVIFIGPAIFFSRKGLSILAGLLPIINNEMNICLNILTTPGGIGTMNLPVFDIFAFDTLLASLLLPFWCTFPVAACNIGLVCLLLLDAPETKDLHHLVLTQPLLFVTPIFLQAVAATISFLGGHNAFNALKEGDRANEVQHLYEEIQRLYYEQERAAVTDVITGLPNHRAIMQKLQEIFLQKDTIPYSILFIDLDHFKCINDTWGHQAGDEVLREAGQRIQGVVQSIGGIAGRYGGEEFAVVLPGVDLSQACQIAETIRTMLVSVPCSWQCGDRQTSAEIPISASIGVAVSPLHGTTQAVLLEAADHAMYCAKQHGRNQVSVAHLHQGEQPCSLLLASE